jgi:hypothetical protein
MNSTEKNASAQRRFLMKDQTQEKKNGRHKIHGKQIPV